MRALAMVVLGVLVILATAFPPTSRPAGAHAQAVVDQTLEGDPDCTGTNFRGIATPGYINDVSDPWAQSVVPASPSLSGVDLCLSLAPGAHRIRLTVRKGTIDGRGTILSQAERTAFGPADRLWVHFPFPAVATQVGEPVVLEVHPAYGVGWAWTCPFVYPDCPTIDPDRYPPGYNTAWSTQTNSDFGFRTYSAGSSGAVLIPRAFIPQLARQTGSLPAPIALEPADEAVFSHYPRTTTLRWSTVPGAVAYIVRIQFFSGGWASYPEVRVVEPQYTFDFVGAQPGRWEVRAVDSTSQPGDSSGFTYFSYTQ